MSELTYIYTYYENPGMLALQYRLWQSYSEDAKRRIKIILVDDASPKKPAANVYRPDDLPELAIYRVKLDVPWHQDGARNLGAHEAEEGWLFLCDIDHALPEKSLHELLKAIKTHPPDRTFFMFPRWDVTPEGFRPVEKGPGANILAMTKQSYWEKMRGYDEDMCGQYGSDGEPRRRLMQHAQKVVLEDCVVTRYERFICADASTMKWERRGPEQDKRRRERLARKAALGREGKITHLDFEWSRVL